MQRVTSGAQVQTKTSAEDTDDDHKQDSEEWHQTDLTEHNNQGGVTGARKKMRSQEKVKPRLDHQVPNRTHEDVRHPLSEEDAAEESRHEILDLDAPQMHTTHQKNDTEPCFTSNTNVSTVCV